MRLSTPSDCRSEHALRLGKIDSNPARGVRRLTSGQRTRRLSVAELAALSEAMRTAAEQGEHPLGLAAVRLILLTSSRRNEAQALQRGSVDFDADCVMFPDTKSGAQVRIVGAVAMIEAQADQPGNPYVFAADWTGTWYKQVRDLVENGCARRRRSRASPRTFSAKPSPASRANSAIRSFRSPDCWATASAA